MPVPPPSARLLRAVTAERGELDRHHARMAEEAAELRRALARIERGLVEIDERRALLDRLTLQGAETRGDVGARGDVAVRGDVATRGDVAARGDVATRGDVAARGDVATRGDVAARGDVATRGDVAARGDVATRGHVATRSDVAARGDARLRGPEIREAAVRVLVARGGDSLHYRDWYALLEDAGHAIAGKDPLAVFLTQLGRSPAVRRGSQAGFYELDRHAAARHRATLEALQRELRELTTAATSDLRAIRARREQLSVEIGRVERALEEIARVLGPAPPLVAAG